LFRRITIWNSKSLSIPLSNIWFLHRYNTIIFIMALFVYIEDYRLI
jgi:hypothetical protein